MYKYVVYNKKTMILAMDLPKKSSKNETNTFYQTEHIRHIYISLLHQTISKYGMDFAW